MNPAGRHDDSLFLSLGSVGSVGSLGWLLDSPHEGDGGAQDHFESGQGASIGIQGVSNVPVEHHGVAQGDPEVAQGGLYATQCDSEVAQGHLESGQGAFNATQCGPKASRPRKSNQIELLRNKKRPPPLEKATKNTFVGNDAIKVHYGMGHYQAGSGKHKRPKSNVAPNRTKIAKFVQDHPEINSVLVLYDRGSGSRTQKQQLEFEKALALREVPLCRVYGRIKRATIKKLLANDGLKTSIKVRVDTFDKEGNPTNTFAMVHWSNLHPVETGDFSPCLAKMQKHGACVTTKVVTNPLD